jgi:mannosyltransferase OCH1-like enzyme
MYNEKKWAFVADYARLTILEREGGIYLDTDMELVKDITPLLDCSLLLGEEEKGIISAGMVGATPHHPYITLCKESYNSITGLPPTIPRLMTSVFNSMKDSMEHVRVCEPVVFYPYSQETISRYKKEDLPTSTYGVHLWNYSWGHPLNRFFKKIGIHRFGTKIVTVLGIKPLLKKILRFS